MKAPTETPASYKARQERRKANAAKELAIAIAKELGKIVADELGITDALDCFTTGSLGACGATAGNIVSSLIGGGPATKLVMKYWNKIDKAYALGKRIVGLGKRLWGAFKDWRKSSKAARAAKSCNSFTPGTRVLMADGTTKAIKDVDIGDKVLATDPVTGETKTETVTAEIKGKGLKHLVKITIDVDGQRGTKTASVTATDGHPFWVPELGKWLKATDLNVGEWLRTSAGTRVQVASIERRTAQSATVHNITVSDMHTYYVLAGAAPVLVHNCNLGDYADSVRNEPGVKFASEYTSPSGAKYYGRNKHGQQAEGELADVLEQTGHHGGCAEVHCLIQAQAAEGAEAIREEQCEQ
ncbi:Hint domain-containing protein [Streptomyces aureus]